MGDHGSRRETMPSLTAHLRHMQATWTAITGRLSSRARDLCILVPAALLMGLLLFDDTLHVSGDNAEFITLGRSLASGQGLTRLSHPEAPLATKFPPGLPALLALIDLLFPDSIIAMKLAVLMVYVVAIATMGWQALAQWFAAGEGWALCALLGAALFTASDGALAVDRT